MSPSRSTVVPSVTHQHEAGPLAIGTGVASDPVIEVMRELVGEMRALRAELKAGRDRKVTTRRVRAVRRAKQIADVPVSDIAAAAARRALAKVTR